MKNETPFQTALLFSIVAFLAVRGYYHLKLGTLREAVASSQNSKIVRMLRPILGVLLLEMPIWLINPGWLSWSDLALPEWVRWSGAGLVAVALGLLICVYQTLGAGFSPTLETRERHRLVTTGPYQWVRHPMYTAIILWAASLLLITADWFDALLPLAFVLFFILRVPDEEKMMVKAFGDEYRVYTERTGRFLPRLIR